MSRPELLHFRTELEKAKNSLNKYVARILQTRGWSTRLGTISQSVPIDWLDAARNNTQRIRDKFRDEKVEVVINCDEVCRTYTYAILPFHIYTVFIQTFVLFHSRSNNFIVPKGTHRVGTSTQVHNEKIGITVMVSAEFRSSSLLPPFIIFTGEYGQTLMIEWNHFEKAKVVFNKTHWSTEETCILYLDFVCDFFTNKRIGKL